MPFRNFELRKRIRDALNFHVAAQSDFHSAAQRFRDFAKDLRHLGGILEVKLVSLELHTIRVAHGLAGLDAEQHFLGVSVVVMKVVTVVGGHERDAGLFRKTGQFGIDIFFDRQSLVLNFEEEIAFAENVAQAVSIFARLIVLLIDDRFGHWATQAGRKRDQAFAMSGEQVVVNARFIIETLKKACGNQFDQVVIALKRFAKQHEVVAAAHCWLGVAALLAVASVGFLAAFMAAAFGYVNFAANDGLDVTLARFV